MKTLTQSFVAALALLGVSLAAPKARALVPPPPGGYPNFTTAAGDHALQALTLGVGNTALGTFSLFSVTSGNFNTAVGAGALDLNTADSNTATGAAALLFNTTGTENTANGTAALEFNDTGNFNTASGAFALFSNTIGLFDTATGARALQSNTTGTFNTANGVQALFLNTIGDGNTATGGLALSSNTTGGSNTANGVEALTNNTIGGQNTADGADALRDNASGNFNTATGFQALANNTTGAGNTALGALAGTAVTTADGVTCIAHGGQNASNTTWIGNVFGTTTLSGTTAPVIVSNTGQLGTMSSSRRFKKEITPMDKASESVLALKPVTFHYKNDSTNAPQFGLIAEEVADVTPDLVVRDANGEIYTVRYEAVNAMLLNEFLKEHRKVEKLEATVADLAAQLRRVSAQVQIKNSSARVADK